MKQKVIFTADSCNERKIKVYKNLSNCIIDKSISLCNNIVSPKVKYMYLSDLGVKKYLLIERYEDQFNNLHKSVIINVLEKNNLKFEEETKEIYNPEKIISQIKIPDMYDYLTEYNKF